MLHATWRSLMGRKLRLLLSAFSIVLGIAFVSGSLMFTNLLGSSFNSILKSGIADVNVSSGGGAFSSTATGPQATVTPELLDKISAIDGVSEATGVVTSTSLYPLDKNGKVLAFGGAPGVGTNWYTTPAAGGAEGARVIDGSAPEKDDQLAIDPSTMQRGGYVVGDKLEVSTPKNGIRTYTIVGTATFPHGISYYQPDVQMASLDHALWFHRAFRADDWLLYSIDSPSAQGGRGLSRGQIFDLQGRLVASTAQEGLIRVVAADDSDLPLHPKG